ncbi:TPA: tandem-type lipoprotein [Staphylococcus aureus]|uniref:tandem-type lipoprotein n=2 Tax=Staphylococcus aureus TaxID=1280 RepID=UPI0005C78747|nr:tandem-type lipoprotein [Staphylococcus aureus]HDJ6917624.1 tandem-type lipoprotein [Staphylococcus aureus Sa_TPS3169]HDJ6920228.1 tandem-type lipoprotein [Staphylococcus aureus Sa_TPS3162]HDJ6928532.1 tandem-type lipoprotein [Staphylococcus aureus Sa_TPS3157]HDJ6931113.1 tandem-type lipoprotein [Staphylococcus aureus Sa_TPS3148]HDJ6936495.1 tandem-type lipoprotein [Staphylococcus aureus Sa_TPS3161]HDJ6942089.1 tandem-type lipoprotein [Staphylococcus aureus Sa_TPS3174]HDJ6947671.1 tandem-
MIHSKKLKLCLCLIILSIFIGGCGMKKEESSKDKQIKENFNKTLSLYPTKNLEDFYDKEGFRDEEFEKGDKGTWIIYSEMVIEPKGKNMETRGMVLYINRNTRTTKGNFIVNEITDDNDGRPIDNKKKYPVKMEHNKIIPTKPLPNDKLKKEIENFKFFVQYGNFKDINDYKDGDISYNPNVPSYSAKYQLNNDDYNVQQLRKRYDIPTKQAPKLLLKGDGDLKGSSIGSKNLEFTFVENKEENIYFTDSVQYTPSEDTRYESN